MKIIIYKYELKELLLKIIPIIPGIGFFYKLVSYYLKPPSSSTKNLKSFSLVFLSVPKICTLS